MLTPAITLRHQRERKKFAMARLTPAQPKATHIVVTGVSPTPNRL